MDQEQIVNAIIEKLQSLKFDFKKNNSHALVVSAQLFKKGLFGSKREIGYDAAILVDANDKAIYFWETVCDVKKGFSFGSESESYTQSGASVHRKVYCNQCDIKGNNYEVELDLGELSCFLKEIAKQNSYKLKVVLKKEKAL